MLGTAVAQGVLNWVAEGQPGQPPPRVELRLYDVLFSGGASAVLHRAASTNTVGWLAEEGVATFTIWHVIVIVDVAVLGSQQGDCC